MVKTHMRKRSQTLYRNLFFLLVLLSLFPDTTQAQWATNGTNIYNSNAGNVGIGTTTPQAKLDVSGTGDMRLSGTTNWGLETSEGPAFQIVDRTNNIRRGIFDTSGNVYLGGPIACVAGCSATMSILSSGRVGIGTTTPQYAIDLGSSAGMISTSGWYKGLRLGSGNAIVLGNSAGQNLYFQAVNGEGFYQGLLATDNGLSAPNYVGRMDQVTGDWRWFKNASIDGKFGIGTATPSGKLSILSNVDQTIVLSRPGYSDWALVQSDNTSLLNRLDLVNYNAGTNNIASFQSNGNVGIGTSSPSTKLHVVGDVTVTGNIAAKYQDVAEWVPASKKIAEGTVVVLDDEHSNQVLPSSQAYDTRVAGVITSKPGLLLGEGGKGKVKVATTGRVKVKVDASQKPIKVGDLLVTGDKEGVAIVSKPMEINGRKFHQPGTILGKALEPLTKGEGEILVLLSLQ